MSQCRIYLWQWTVSLLMHCLGGFKRITRLQCLIFKLGTYSTVISSSTPKLRGHVNKPPLVITQWCGTIIYTKTCTHINIHTYTRTRKHNIHKDTHICDRLLFISVWQIPSKCFGRLSTILACSCPRYDEAGLNPEPCDWGTNYLKTITYLQLHLLFAVRLDGIHPTL